jgi:alpha-L-fucosidase
LNIGPASDGSVVPFEADVIRLIGRWLDENGDAIYGTRPSPFKNTVFDWGHVTVKGNVMYLLLTGEYPEVGISYPIAEGLSDVEGASWQIYGGMCIINVTPEMFGKPDVKVIKMVYDRPVADRFTYPYLLGTDVMTWKNAMPDYSYSCFDYYSNYRSVVGYGWEVSVQRPVKMVELTYTAEEVGRMVKVCVGDMEMDVTLDSLDAVSVKPSVEVGTLEFGRMRGGVFDNSVSVDRVPQWVAMDGSLVQVPSQGFANYLLKTELQVDKPSCAVFDVCAGNGVELLVDGKTMMKHLNPYRTSARTEKVVLDLHKGNHEVILRSYNRFEDNVVAGFALSDAQNVYRKRLTLPHMLDKGDIHVGISPLDIPSPHTDCGLHNLRLRLMK